MVGDATVGKTSLVQRYANDSFNRHYKSTVGGESRPRRLRSPPPVGPPAGLRTRVGAPHSALLTPLLPPHPSALTGNSPLVLPAGAAAGVGERSRSAAPAAPGRSCPPSRHTRGGPDPPPPGNSRPRGALTAGVGRCRPRPLPAEPTAAALCVSQRQTAAPVPAALCEGDGGNESFVTGRVGTTLWGVFV